jgi:hypothetical protein
MFHVCCAPWQFTRHCKADDSCFGSHEIPTGCPKPRYSRPSSGSRMTPCRDNSIIIGLTARARARKQLPTPSMYQPCTQNRPIHSLQVYLAPSDILTPAPRVPAAASQKSGLYPRAQLLMHSTPLEDSSTLLVPLHYTAPYLLSQRQCIVILLLKGLFPGSIEPLL